MASHSKRKSRRNSWRWRRKSTYGRQHRSTARLGFEQLEPRQLLAVLYWDPGHSGGAALGGSGTWTGTNNWWNGSSDVTWSSGDEARFDGTAATVTLGSAITASAVSFLSDGFTLSGNSLTLTGTGTTLSADQSATISSSLVIAASQKVSVASGELLTVSGVISGSGTLDKFGSGTLTVSGSDTFSGGTTIEDGTLKLGKANALPTTTVITFGTSSTDGALELNGFNQQVAGLIVASGATAANQVIGNSSATADAKLTYSASGGPTSTFAGTIEDKITGTATHKTSIASSAGTLVLAGTNTYTGGTSISGGTLQFSTGSLGSTGNITMSGTSTLQWASGNTTDISSRFVVGSGTATVDIGANNVTFATAPTVVSSLTKIGSGKLTLTASMNAGSATLTIGAGTLQLGNGGTTGSVSFGSVVNNASLVFDRSDQYIFTPLISGTGNVVQTGSGSLKLASTSNSYSGGTSLQSGTVEFVSGGLASTGNITFAGNSTLKWSTSVTTDLSSRLVINNGVTATLDLGANNVTFASGIGSSGSGAVTKAGSGALTFAAANSYTGTTTVTAGSLNVTSSNGTVGNVAINTGTTVSFVSGGLGGSGTITLSGTSTLQWSSGNTDDISSRLVISSGATSTFNIGSNNVTLSTGFGGSGTGKVVKSGSGTLTLTGSNSYTGGTTITGGTVEFASGGLSSSGTIKFTSSATLRWLTGNTTDISSRYSSDSGVNITIDVGSNNVSFGSGIVVLGSFTKQGSGTLSLGSSLNSSSGTATISAGTLQIGTGGTSGSLGFSTIVNNASLVFKRSDFQIISALISGTGSVTTTGTGELELSNTSNSYSGGTNIQSGQLDFWHGALGTTGAITFTGNSLLRWLWSMSSTNTEDVSGRLAINNGVTVTFDTDQNNVTLASAFGGGNSGSAIKVGNGTLTYGASNTYTGSTTVNAGVLAYDVEAAVNGSGHLTANNFAEVDFYDGLAFSSDGLFVLNGNSKAYFVGDSTVTGVGTINIASSDAKVYERGVDSMTPGTLTIDVDSTVRGQGMIDGYYTSDALANDGTIEAEVGTLSIALPYTNDGTFAASTTGRLDRSGTQLHGSQNAVSGTELLLFWSDLTAGASTYTVEISDDGGITYSPVNTVSSGDATYLFDKLQRNSTYALRLVADYSDGSKEIYYSDPVATLDKADESGWYRVSIQNHDPDGPSFATAAPSVNVDYSGVFAGSPSGAMLRSLGGAVRDATIPTPDDPIDPDDPMFAPIPLYKAASGHPERYSFDPVTPEGPMSFPARFDLNAEPMDGDPNAGESDDPVFYFDGMVDFSTTDLQSNGLAAPFAQTRSWAGASAFAVGQHNGTGWVDSIPSIQESFGSQSISVIRGATDVETFELSDGQYVPTSYSPETLIHDTDNHEFVWADSLGNSIHFYDFSTYAPAGRAGEFKSLVSAGGIITEVTDWTGDGAIQEIRRKDANGNAVESWLYTYLDSPDPNAGLLANVQLRQTDGESGWNIVRQVDYEYYDGIEDYGNLGDLKLAVVKDAGGDVLDTSYYRYYTPGDEGGYVHGLKYAFDTYSYSRLVAAVGDPTTAADNEIAPYAQHYFEYDEFARCTRHDIHSLGGTSTAGIGTFTYEYDTNSVFSEDSNDWMYRTIETLPDGNQNIVYCNAGGAMLVKDFEDINDSGDASLEGGHWITAYQYDSMGRLIQEADPSAIVSYEIDGSNNLVVTLASSAGLIHLTSYYTSTTATDTTAGGVLGFVESSSVQEGSGGTPVLEHESDYFVQTADGRTNVVTADDTQYRNTNGTGGETTSFAYTWFTDTVAVESIITSLPIVSTSQNGSGDANAGTVFRDKYGRTIWSMDADGYLTYTEYDELTGAVSKSISDVNTDNTADFSDLPSGWESPTEGSLHLITTMETDPLGRTTKMVDPAGNVTYTVYNDADHELRIYAGWNSSTHNTAAAVTVIREDRDYNYDETLTFVWDDSEGLPVDLSGRPTGEESLSDPSAVIQSLSRTLFNSAGQAESTRNYTSLDGVTYSTDRDLGESGTNYLETDDVYTDRGWMDVLVESSGMIHHRFYDALGRVAQEWAGRDDVPTTDYNGDSVLNEDDLRYWVEQNPTAVEGPAGTSMYKATLNVYDNGAAGGDSNLTDTRTFFGNGGSDFYDTYQAYDWRDRKIAMLGPDGVATVLTLDNLSQTTESQTYANSTFDSGAITAGDLRAVAVLLR